MQSARKLKRVSWAPGSHLCQVKFFSSEDCPSKVGNKSQRDFQAMTSSTWPLTTNEYHDSLPEFEGNYFQNQSKSQFCNMSLIKWECPPSIVLSSSWRVAAGEESVEKYEQMLRETRVSEAYYPSISAIPPSPSVAFNVENEWYDDSLTPVIPQICIEEYESVPDITPVPFSGPVSAHTTTHSVTRNPTPHVHMPVKNIDYCRDLVRKYGGNSEQDTQNHNNFQGLKRPRIINPAEVKMKIQKPCKFYKTSRGCGHGSHCRYQHDGSVRRM